MTARSDRAQAAPGRTTGPPVQARNATRRFNGVTAVDDVTLEVPQGTILGLIGPSGSGKTTMVRMMTGTLAPTAGSIEVLGENPRRFRRRTRERIGYMPQNFVLYPDLTSLENVSFVASLFGLFWWRKRGRIREVLELLDLWEVRHRRARDLSGGMQRRLELACALVHDPAVVFVDEPTAGIDPLLRQTVWDELRRLRDAGRTLLVTTQYVGEAEYCDRVALLSTGKLIAYEAPDRMRRAVVGGEMLEIETAQVVGPDALAGVPEVSRARQVTPTKLHAIVENAGAATPAVLAAIERAGGRVMSISEYRPSFDEIFTEIVIRHRRAGGGGDAPG
jgi:ABC-2 type transport system ATP-binding protein